MALIRGKPLTWRPSGLSDAVDGTNAPPGAMASLQNLIPDLTTRSVFVPRPAATLLAQQQGVGTGRNISAMLILGNIVYGMANSAEYAGFDAPFAFNLVTQSYQTITGITASNLPASQPAYGDWVPPTMDTVGIYLLITHPGFDGGTNGFLGWLDISNVDAPVWNSGNTRGAVILPSPPTAVAVYNGRAYWAVGNAIVFSDSLYPLQVTNAAQVLIIGDASPVTALKGLPLDNQVTGGIVQSLIAFKGVSVMYQLTGDYSQDNLVLNAMNVATGTLAPNSVVATPTGLMFLAPDGFRYVDFNGNIQDPIGVQGTGVAYPFINAKPQSRIAAAYGTNVFRVQMPVPNGPAGAYQEYWYHLDFKSWTGPHTFGPSICRPYRNTFICGTPDILSGLTSYWDGGAIWDGAQSYWV